MYWLHRLHIVDCAVNTTSNADPHSKQEIFLRSGSVAAFFAAAGARVFFAGFNTSSSRKCPPHFLQFDDIAVRGSFCLTPQGGQATTPFSPVFTGIKPLPIKNPR